MLKLWGEASYAEWVGLWRTSAVSHLGQNSDKSFVQIPDDERFTFLGQIPDDERFTFSHLKHHPENHPCPHTLP